MKAEWTNRDSLSTETTSQNSKAVLVIDMPTHCGECPVRCRMRGINHVPTCCPLKPLPKHKYGFEDNGLSPSVQILIQSGWNDCLAEITGETE